MNANVVKMVGFGLVFGKVIPSVAQDRYISQIVNPFGIVREIESVLPGLSVGIAVCAIIWFGFQALASK